LTLSVRLQSSSPASARRRQSRFRLPTVSLCYVSAARLVARARCSRAWLVRSLATDSC